jgi:hypothetical protein
VREYRGRESEKESKSNERFWEAGAAVVEVVEVVGIRGRGFYYNTRGTCDSGEPQGEQRFPLAVPPRQATPL